MATEETLQKLREIGKKLREAKLRYYGTNDVATLRDIKDEFNALDKEAGRICETEL